MDGPPNKCNFTEFVEFSENDLKTLDEKEYNLLSVLSPDIKSPKKPNALLIFGL